MTISLSLVGGTELTGLFPMQEWYEDWRNLRDLSRWLIEESGYDAEQLLKFLEEPWKWKREWQAYLWEQQCTD